MEAQIKTIKIIHYSLCAGVILVYFMIGEIYKLENITLPNVNSEGLIFIIIPIATYFTGNFMFKIMLQGIDKKLPFEEKIIPYQTASLVRWGIIEGAIFVILFVAPNLILFGILLILYLVYLRPTEDKIKMDLNETTI